MPERTMPDRPAPTRGNAAPTRPPSTAATATTATATAADAGSAGRVEHPWRELARRWPLRWGDLGMFVVAYALLTAVFVGLGALVVGPLDGSVGEVDRDLAQRMADGRTPGVDDLSSWASMLAETAVKIALTAVVIAAMLAVWRRWEEALLVATALILEASVFITVTWIVGRERPAVPRLDASPVDSSFPSGHVAAAVVYGAFAIIVARHARRRWPVVLAVGITVVVSLAVGWARLYRGMHHLSDVMAGIALGLVSLVATWRIMRRAEDRERSRLTGVEP